MLGKWPKSRHVVVQSMGFTPYLGKITSALTHLFGVGQM